MNILNESLILRINEDIIWLLRERIWELETPLCQVPTEIKSEHDKFLNYNARQLKRKVIRVRQFNSGLAKLKTLDEESLRDLSTFSQSEQETYKWILGLLKTIEDFLVVTKYSQRTDYEKIIFILPALESSYQMTLSPMYPKYFWLQHQFQSREVNRDAS